MRTSPVHATKRLKQEVGGYLESYGTGFQLRRLDTPARTAQPVELLSSKDPDDAVVMGTLPEWFSAALPLGAMEQFAIPITATCQAQGRTYQEDGKLYTYLVFEPDHVRGANLGDLENLGKLADNFSNAFTSIETDPSENESRLRELLQEKLAALGVYRGIHFLDTPEVIQNLKREGLYEEALEIALTATEAAFREASLSPNERSYPAPFYAKQAGIILRKLGRKEESLALAKRYEESLPPRQ